MRKNWFKLLYREINAVSPITLWLFPLFAGAGLLLLLDTQADEAMRLEQILVAVEILLPLAVMFLSNELILREKEENTLVFVATRSSLRTLWLRRLGILLLTSTFWVGILLILYRFFYLSFSVGQMLFAFVSVSLALVGISNSASLVLKEMNAGYLMGTFFWAVCWIGYRTAFVVFGPRLYLFYLWYGVRENVNAEEWLYNKLVLAGLGILFIFGATWFLRTERLST